MTTIASTPVTQTRAAVLYDMQAKPPYADSRPLKIETIALAAPQRDEVMVKIAAAGLCHSDLSVMNGDRPRPMPMALGHEAAGVVVEIGEGVNDVAVGDHVVLVFVPSCGHCDPCAEGRPALCEPGAAANGAGTLLSGARRISHINAHIKSHINTHINSAEVTPKNPLNHHLGCSVFAEYAVVSRRSVVKIKPEIPLEHAALFGCAVLTGVGAVVNTAKVSLGASVAILGLGGVGLAAVLGAVAAGARQIIAVDLSDEKLAFAKTLGATHVMNAAATDAVAQIRALTTKNGGVEYAFEFAGSTKALELAYAITRRGGMTVTAGLPPSNAMLSIPAVSLVAEERTLKGSYIGTCVPQRDLPHFMDLYLQGRLPVDKLLTGRVTLDTINEGFDALHQGLAIRQVLVPH